MMVDESLMVESRLKEAFATLPDIETRHLERKNLITLSVKYGFGSEEELHEWLNDKRDANLFAYPLIWVQTPFTATGKKPRVNVPIRLILATLTSADFTNDERIEISFKPILNPLLSNVIKLFNRSGFTTIRNREREKRTNHFKFSVDGENKSTAVWDAIVFEGEIEMNDCPLREVPY